MKTEGLFPLPFIKNYEDLMSSLGLTNGYGHNTISSVWCIVQTVQMQNGLEDTRMLLSDGVFFTHKECAEYVIDHKYTNCYPKEIPINRQSIFSDVIHLLIYLSGRIQAANAIMESFTLRSIKKSIDFGYTGEEVLESLCDEMGCAYSEELLIEVLGSDTYHNILSYKP